MSSLYSAQLCSVCTLHKMDKCEAPVVFDCSARKSYHIHFEAMVQRFPCLSPMASIQFDLDVRVEKTRNFFSPIQLLNAYKSLARKSNSCGVKV